MSNLYVLVCYLVLKGGVILKAMAVISPPWYCAHTPDDCLFIIVHLYMYIEIYLYIYDRVHKNNRLSFSAVSDGCEIQLI